MRMIKSLLKPSLVTVKQKNDCFRLSAQYLVLTYLSMKEQVKRVKSIQL